MTLTLLLIKGVCGGCDTSTVLESTTDLACGAMVIVYIALVFPTRISSAQTVSTLLSALDDIPWASPDYALTQKKKDFFVNIEQLLSDVEYNELLDLLLNLLLLVNLLR